jgi:hypothetical protein
MDLAEGFYDMPTDFESLDLDYLRGVMNESVVVDGLELVDLDVVALGPVRTIVGVLRGHPFADAPNFASVFIPFADCFWTMRLQIRPRRRR